jgi:primosomal protein N' (replication factor Y)
VAEVKPLRLKTQRVPKKVALATQNPVAQVCVDTGVYHLGDIFDYLVPEELSSLLVPGIFVDIPFGPKQVSGYVVSRKSSELDYSKLKFITKAISPIPLLSEELLVIITDTCSRYACKPFDVIRSAIPPRVAGAETKYLNQTLPNPSPVKLDLSHRLTVTMQVNGLLNEVIKECGALKDDAQLLVIVPDERDIAQLLSEELPIAPTILTTDISKSERYSNYLKARFESPKLLIGTRSAIFTPLNVNSKIIIFNDNDESMYERRNPGWNVRDVALLRSGDYSLHFVSCAPSPEVVRLTELGWIKRNREGGSDTKKSLAIQFADSRVSDISVIKTGLKTGNVLVVMAETGYINAIACQKCKNQAKCECGGKLYIPGKQSNATCFLCEKLYANWKCSWCGGENIRALGKGSNRYAEEIAKAVPGFRVILSKGGSRVDFLPQAEENFLVIASYGCEPKGKYSAVVLNSLENLTNRVDLRSLEYARRVIFENLNRVTAVPEATAYVSLLPDNPISQSLLRRDAYGLCLSEIEDRKSSALPPFVRMATLVGEASALRQLSKQLSSNELFLEISIIKNTDSRNPNPSIAKMILRSEIEKSAEFSEFFRDLARYRGIKGLSPIQIRIDPFSI